MHDAPIDFYYWPTPNGYKVAILLEEAGLPYRVRPVNISRGQQFDPQFLRISPNNKVPAIVDPDGPGGEPFSLFESGAILLYLAAKCGQFLPREGERYWRTIEWLMFQMGSLGPMLGQAHHFRKYAPETIPYAVRRYTNEAGRLYRVLERHLDESAWLAGEEYTIADIATWPWIRSHAKQGQDLAAYPHLERWFQSIAQRPAVQRGVGLLAERGEEIDEQGLEFLFGESQYQSR